MVSARRYTNNWRKDVRKVKVFKSVYTVKKELDEIICNMCGSRIEKDEYGNFHDYLHIEKSWGYHSEKDGEAHRFDLCEKCYDRLLKEFKIEHEK